VLVDSLKAAKLFEDIYVWDRVEGLIDGDAAKLKISQAETNGNAPVKGLDDSLFDDDKGQSGQYKTPQNFYALVYQNLLNDKRRVCFIINYSNYLFPGEQGFSDCDRDDLTKLVRGTREQNIKISKGGSTIIFITSNLAHKPVSIYQNNPDSGTITITLPDRDERKEIIDSIASQFKLEPDLDSDEQGKVNLIDGTDNFKAKEIIQLVQLSKTGQGNDDFFTMEKLLSLYKYGKKESPWELLDSKKVRQINEILGRRVKGQY
jgi:hypothetical protein